MGVRRMKEIDVLQIFKEYYPSYIRGDTPLEPYYSFFCGGFSVCEETLVKELENQIEKMKCYLNCANNSDECLGKNCYGCKNWKLSE